MTANTTFFVAQRGVGLPRRPSTRCCGDSLARNASPEQYQAEIGGYPGNVSLNAVGITQECGGGSLDNRLLFRRSDFKVVRSRMPEG